MVRVIKWLLASLITLALILVVGVLILTIVIDPNNYKPKLQELAAEQGIILEMRGDLSWGFLPSLALELNDSTLAIPEQGIENFAFENISLSLDKWQLLNRNIVFQSIDIEKADITARTLGDAGKVAAIPAASSNKNTQTGSTVTSDDESFSLAVEAFSISNSRLKILQSESEPNMVLTDIDFSVRDVNLKNQAFPVSLAFNMAIDEQPPLDLSLTTDVSIQVDSKNASLATLLNEANQSLLETLKITLSTVQIEANHGVGKQAVSLESNLIAHFDNKLDQLTINDWKFNLPNLTGSGDLNITNFKTTPTVTGQLDAETDDLPALLTDFLVEADAPVKHAAIKSKISATADQLKLGDLTIQLDKQRFTGHLNLGIATPRNLDLVLNGNEWTLPKTDQNETTATSTEPATGILTALLSPLALLEGGKGHIELTMAALHLPDYSIEKLKLNIFSNQQVIRIAEVSGKLFKGTMTGNGRIDLSQPKPAINFTTQINAMDLQEALTTLGDYSDFSGNLTLDLTANSQGDSFEQLQANAKGQGVFSITQPVLHNLNIEKSVCEATALVSSKTYSPANTTNKTTLEDIKGDIAIKGNTISIKQLTTKTGNLALVANGDVNLLKGNIAVLASARIQGDKTSEQGCSVNKRLRNTDIPIQCSGPFTGEISCKPDPTWINNMVKGALMDEISNRFLKTQKSTTEDKTTTETEPPSEKKSDVEKAQETLDLLKGIFK